MKFNRKGELGFPEAIMAAMIVTLALTMYIGLFVLNTADGNDTAGVSVDHRIFGGLVLEDGEVAGDIETPLISEMERHGFRGISFLCEIPGDLGFKSRHVVVGDMEGSISSERFLFSLTSADGRILTAVMEVAVCV